MSVLEYIKRFIISAANKTKSLSAGPIVAAKGLKNIAVKGFKIGFRIKF